MRNIFRSITIAAIISVSPHAWAMPETPEQVVERYHQEFEKGRWLALSAFLHPQELANFKITFLSLFSDDNVKTRQSVEQLYGTGATLKTVSEATDEAFLRPILVMLNERLDSGRLRITSQKVIGGVAEGDLYHVVYRWQSESPQLKMSQVEIRTLRKYNDTWRLILPMNLEGAIPAVKRSLQQ
jgi:hypothetical protein